VSRLFGEVKERRSLARMALSRALPKTEGFILRGVTKDTEHAELRAFFIKDAKGKRTCEVLFITDLARMGEDSPELEEILSSFRLRN